MTLAQFAEQPYTFYVQEQKFVLLWIVQPEDSDAEDGFELQANGVSLSKLEYLNLDFKLIDQDILVFDAKFDIND